MNAIKTQLEHVIFGLNPIQYKNHVVQVYKSSVRKVFF
ncbi:MAG: hypothetical protein ACJA2M_002723 [Polaribacter sp.]|jgi:hypothetical protein